MNATTDPLIIAGRTIRSRLFVGTGKFSGTDVLRETLVASGAEIVTVALRRVDMRQSGGPILDAIDTNEMLLLPNTSGARDADEAIRAAELGRNLAGHGWVKLEVTPDPETLLPDPVETLRAAEVLVQRGFTVLPYINADPILARRLEDVGCATVMPLAAPIGSNRGLQTTEMLRIIIDQARVPVVIDAGIGLPGHACAAMELGADAVLVNTALATAKDPVGMARAFAMAVEAGRASIQAGQGTAMAHGAAAASSPLSGILGR